MIALFKWLVIAAIVALCTAIVRLSTLLLPGSRAVRARNALLLRHGAGIRLDWTPADVPADFRTGDASVPDIIERALRDTGIRMIGDDRERALAMTGFLMRSAGEGGGIRADLATTWRDTRRGLGYCADYVRLYMAAAAHVGLFCRRWAFSFDGYGSHGHTFVEVYDRNRASWMFIDVHNNVYAATAQSDRPLGAMELRAELTRDPLNVRFVRASDARLGYPHHEKLVQYYLRGVREWCLWWGNDEARRERGLLARVLLTVSGKLAYRLVTGTLRAPPLIAVEPGHDQAALLRMAALRRQIAYAGGIAAASAAVLIVVLLAMTFAEHRANPDAHLEPVRVFASGSQS